jgi:hypothetical protein
MESQYRQPIDSEHLGYSEQSRLRPRSENQNWHVNVYKPAEGLSTAKNSDIL